MKLYIVDAFTDTLFSGNQAGVALLAPGEDFPPAVFMRQVAAELKHSETAFVKTLTHDTFQIRYFTPVEEVDLCGHATIASFTVLHQEKLITEGSHTAVTLAGKLHITVSQEVIWMDMTEPRELRNFSEEESVALYQAYGLDLSHQPKGLTPKIITTGLSDILLPVNCYDVLVEANQRTVPVTRLSSAYEAVGFHLFYVSPEDNVTAHCRNFAPLYGIDEESATGTANGALTYYLYQYGLIRPKEENTFIQGESMGKPSVIKSRLTLENNKVLIRIGGTGVISLKGELWG